MHQTPISNHCQVIAADAYLAHQPADPIKVHLTVAFGAFQLLLVVLFLG